ncbi:hypothetical protein HW555_008126, partial [Spodoptera exigua]
SMVRDYKRRTNRGGWSEEQMKLAIQAVLDGKNGYKSASKTYNVPQTTLERKVNQARKRDNNILNVKVPLGPITTVFSEEEEQILVTYLKEMEGRLFGLSTSELQKLAYELAVRNNKQHKFNELKEKAGKDWLRGFLHRHPDLSLRKPENTSAALSVGKYFELLGKALDDNPFTPDRIYNCDETGISVVPKSRSKVIAATGKTQVGALTSAEREATEIELNAETEPEVDITPTPYVAVIPQETLAVPSTIISPDPQMATGSALNSSANNVDPVAPTTSNLVQQAPGNDSLDTSFNLVSPKQLMPYPRMAEKRPRQ